MEYIQIKNNILTKEDCIECINIFNKLDIRNGMVATINNKNEYKPNKKNTLSASYDFSNLPNSIQLKILNSINEYVHSYTFIPKFGSIQITFHMYKQNEGFMKKHVDANITCTSKRFLAFIIYLNTVDEGGETIFTKPIELKIKPKEGNILFFPPFWMYEHEGNMPISNDKYIITGFLCYESIN
jgi:hypothetical protein